MDSGRIPRRRRWHAGSNAVHHAPIAAALAVLATGCCLVLDTHDACLEPRYGSPTCRPVSNSQTVCDSGPPRTHGDCTGEIHEDTDCADLGYTVSCGGAYFVPPGNRC